MPDAGYRMLDAGFGELDFWIVGHGNDDQPVGRNQMSEVRGQKTGMMEGFLNDDHSSRRTSITNDDHASWRTSW